MFRSGNHFRITTYCPHRRYYNTAQNFAHLIKLTRFMHISHSAVSRELASGSAQEKHACFSTGYRYRFETVKKNGPRSLIEDSHQRMHEGRCDGTDPRDDVNKTSGDCSHGCRKDLTPVHTQDRPPDLSRQFCD